MQLENRLLGTLPNYWLDIFLDYLIQPNPSRGNLLKRTIVTFVYP